MSITPLSAARIAGELGLAGGTATGGAFALKYEKQLGESERKINEYENKKKENNGNNHQLGLKISALGSNSLALQDYCQKEKYQQKQCDLEVGKVVAQIRELQSLMQGKAD